MIESVKMHKEILKEAEDLPGVIKGLTQAVIDLHNKQNEIIDEVNKMQNTLDEYGIQ